MCAPLGDIDKSGGLLRPEAFSALGDYGVSVCICPEEQRHALPDLSALQTRKPFLRVQHGRGFACAANGKGCILRNGEGGRVVKIQIEIAVIRSSIRIFLATVTVFASLAGVTVQNQPSVGVSSYQPSQAGFFL